MTKYEFLGDLSRLLSDLPEEERRQAMKYYEDYFADAGESQEQQVLRELGSPEDIAKEIKSDSSENIEYGEGSSSHMRNFAQPCPSSPQNGEDNNNQGQTQGGQQNRQSGNSNHSQSSNSSWQTQTEQDNWQYKQTHNTQNNWQSGQAANSQSAQNKSASDSTKTALLVILIIITSPIWGSILLGIFSLAIGILSAILGIFSALILGGGGVAIGGFACVFGGIFACFVGEIASGLLTVGIGCVMFAAGSICCYLGIMLCIKLIPAIWRECVKGFGWGKQKLNQAFHV